MAVELTQGQISNFANGAKCLLVQKFCKVASYKSIGDQAYLCEFYKWWDIQQKLQVIGKFRKLQAGVAAYGILTETVGFELGGSMQAFINGNPISEVVYEDFDQGIGTLLYESINNYGSIYTAEVLTDLGPLGSIKIIAPVSLGCAGNSLDLTLVINSSTGQVTITPFAGGVSEYLIANQCIPYADIIPVMEFIKRELQVCDSLYNLKSTKSVFISGARSEVQATSWAYAGGGIPYRFQYFVGGVAISSVTSIPEVYFTTLNFQAIWNIINASLNTGWTLQSFNSANPLPFFIVYPTGYGAEPNGTYLSVAYYDDSGTLISTEDNGIFQNGVDATDAVYEEVDPTPCESCSCSCCSDCN